MRAGPLFAGIALAVGCMAQQPITIGEVRTLHSTVLGEDRILNIAWPADHQPGDTVRYPVIYLLDGTMDDDFLHVAGALQFAAFGWVGWQRPSIVVGIANVDRKRDFTFPTTVAADKEQFPTTGGSQAFINFLAQELIPFVDAQYHTTKDRLLIGQSLGGLLAAEVLFERPELFQRYLIVSPSIWWDNGSLLARKAAFLTHPERAPAEVFIAVGKEGRRMESDARKLYARVRKSRAIRSGFGHLPKHDHGNILHQAVLDGFRWMGSVR